MLAFFAKTQRFLAKIVPLLKAIVWKLCLRLFSSIFIFSKIKCFYKWKHKFYNYASGIRFPDWSKIGKITVMSQFLDIFKLFWRCFVCLVNFSYWSKFHVNIITASGVMTIFYYKGLTRNPEIGNTPVRLLLNICILRGVRDTKCCTSVSNKTWLNAAKCQGYKFYRFWVIKGKPIGEE